MFSYGRVVASRYIQNRFGKTQLLKDGYVSKRNASVQNIFKTKQYWYCHNKPCNYMASAGTIGNTVLYWKGEHDHASNLKDNEIILDCN